MATTLENPVTGMWDFDFPEEWAGSKYALSAKTFSVGIFQWLPTADGKKLKRGGAIKRIKGYTSDPEKVRAKCQAEINYLNELQELGNNNPALSSAITKAEDIMLKVLEAGSNPNV